MEEIFGNRLESSGGHVATRTLENIRFKCLLFSANWCPPCRLFLGELRAFYEEVNKGQKQLEIIWISRDRTAEEFRDFFKQMPWLAVPFNVNQNQKLLNHYEVEGMPKVLLVDNQGSLIYDSCRTDINSKGIQCLEEWAEMLGS